MIKFLRKIFLFSFFVSVVSVVLPINIANAAACVSPTITTYTSGTKSYKAVKFTTTGSCDYTLPTGVTSIDYLVVGGGGAGGGSQLSTHYAGGGGGAGGVRYGSVVITQTTFTITVGAGQAVGCASGRASDSSLAGTGITTVSATGGGRGSCNKSTSDGAGGIDGSTGGSGGGAGSQVYAKTFGAGNLGSYSPSEGYGGGTSINDTTNAANQAAGGGGGATASGANATTGCAGKGGNGYTSSITGTSTVYGGGGGGGTRSANCGGAAGTGGGGTGGVAGGQGTAGTDGLGGGGGGTSLANGNKGGSGVVIIRYVNFFAPIITSTSTGSNSITLNWSAPAGTFDYYQVQFSTDGSTWTDASTTVSNSALTYTITGLTGGSSYYTRIATLTGGIAGAWAYPWTKIYGTSTANRDLAGKITYQSTYGLGTSDAAYVNRNASYTRIRYRMEATFDGLARYADVNFLKSSFSALSSSTTIDSISKLQLPASSGTDGLGNSSNFILQGSVTDMTVTSNSSAYASGTNTYNAVQNTFGSSGRLEIWPCDYSNTAPTGWTARSGTAVYDDADTAASASCGNGNYGSFQVHNQDSNILQTVIAWNRHTNGYTADIGYGNYAGTSDSDWTFAAQQVGYSTRSAFQMEVFINIPIYVQTQLTTPNTPTASATSNTLKSIDVAWSAVTNATTYTVNLYNSTGVTLLKSVTGISILSEVLTASDYSSIADNTAYQVSVTAIGTGGYSNSSESPKVSVTTNAQPVNPTISAQPASATISTGASNTFSVTASVTDSGSITYQWQVSTNSGSTWANVASNGNSSSYATGTVTVSSNGYQYKVIVTNSKNGATATTTSNAATLTVGTATSTITISLPGGATSATYNSAVTITASTSVNGSVNFKVGGTTITGCGAVSTSALSATCSWTPSTTGSNALTAVLSPTDSSNYTSSTSVTVNVNVGTAVTTTTITVDAGQPEFLVAKNISATASVAGTVNFMFNGKTIPGCFAKATNGSLVATCSWKPGVRTTVTITATLSPTNSAYAPSTSDPVTVTVKARTGARTP